MLRQDVQDIVLSQPFAIACHTPQNLPFSPYIEHFSNLHILLCMCHLLLSDLMARLPLHVHHMAEERLVLLLLRDSHHLDNLLVFGQVPLLLHLAVPLLVKKNAAEGWTATRRVSPAQVL